MAPWINGQPIYAPVSNGTSQASYPLLYSGQSAQESISASCAYQVYQLSLSLSKLFITHCAWFGLCLFMQRPEYKSKVEFKL